PLRAFLRLIRTCLLAARRCRPGEDRGQFRQGRSDRDSAEERRSAKVEEDRSQSCLTSRREADLALPRAVCVLSREETCHDTPLNCLAVPCRWRARENPDAG